MTTWWKFWKRNTEDPLLRELLDKYHIHLLSVPRENVNVGDLCVDDGKAVTASGRLSDFLQCKGIAPNQLVPHWKDGEVMVDLSGKVSNSTSTDISISLLGSFLSAFGVESVLRSTRIAYEREKVSFLRFRFPNLLRDAANVARLGTNLERCRIPEHHPLYAKDYKYYVITAVIRTSSISMTAEDSTGKVADIDARAIGLDTSSHFSMSKSSVGELTFSGEKALVVGVELHKLDYYPDTGFKITGLDKLIGLRPLGAPDQDFGEIRKPSFIGDSEDGTVFLELV